MTAWVLYLSTVDWGWPGQAAGCKDPLIAACIFNIVFGVESPNTVVENFKRLACDIF